MPYQKTKVFVSFDFDNDKTLKECIIGQSKLPDSPFKVSGYSVKEPAPEGDWLTTARSAIAGCDVFIVLLGRYTKNAPGVLKEARIANELNKRKFQIIGYPTGTRDWAVPNGGAVYCWTWDNLKKLLA